MAEKPEDLSLPSAVVQRVVKEALPDGIIVSKEARQTISRAASVFVLFLTACAVTYASKSKRKTLAVSDIFAALKDMEFASFVAPLADFLENKKETTIAKPQTKKASAASTDAVEDEPAVEELEEAGMNVSSADELDQPGKKLRLMPDEPVAEAEAAASQ